MPCPRRAAELARVPIHMKLGSSTLALALLSAWMPLAAKDQEPAQPPLDPNAMMSNFIAPLQNLAKATVNETMDAKCASAWALWDMLGGIKKQRDDGAAKPEPDLGLVETYLRLTMRLNTGDLKRFGSKPYPGDDDFKWAVNEAGKGIRSCLAALKPEDDLLGAKPRGAVEKAMAKALNRMIAFHLRGQQHGILEVPPYAQGGESFYVNKARMNKSGETYSFPPWPEKS